MAAVWALSCKEEPSVLSLENEGSGELMDVLERYEIEYGVNIKSNFDATDFGPVNFGVQLPYTPAIDVEGITQLLKYFEDNALSYFPKEFISEYMPRTILLVDSLVSVYKYVDTYNDPNVKWTERRPIPGYVTDRYLVLGNAGQRFDPNAEGLKEEMISLLVERLLSNSDRLPKLDDFVAATENAVTACGAVWMNGTSIFAINYPYWNGILNVGGGSYDWTLFYELRTPWLGYGVLKPGREGFVAYANESLAGFHIRAFSADKGTKEKDFGDFTAFLLTKTAAEREAFYTSVAVADSLGLTDSTTFAKYPERVEVRDGKYYDKRFPYYGGQIGADAIRAKVAIVRAWWQQLGITLKEPE
jgi:hypothetical protein